MSAIVDALLAELADDDEALDLLAERLAPRLAARVERQEHDSGWLDVAGAAEHLACPKSRVYSLTAANRLPCHRDGSRLLFRAAELDEFVRAGGARRR